MNRSFVRGASTLQKKKLRKDWRDFARRLIKAGFPELASEWLKRARNG